MLRDVFPDDSVCVKPWQAKPGCAVAVSNIFVISSSGKHALDFVVGRVYYTDKSLITDFNPVAELIIDELESEGLLNQSFECAAVSIIDRFANFPSELNELEIHFIEMRPVEARVLLPKNNHP